MIEDQVAENKPLNHKTGVWGRGYQKVNTPATVDCPLFTVHYPLSHWPANPAYLPISFCNSISVTATVFEASENVEPVAIIRSASSFLPVFTVAATLPASR